MLALKRGFLAMVTLLPIANVVHAAGIVSQAPAFNLIIDYGSDGTTDWNGQNAGLTVVDLDGNKGNLFGIADGSFQSRSGNWSLDWSGMQFDPDPLLTGTVGLTNLTNATQNFTVNFSLPVSPAISAPTQYRGAITATVVDRNGNSIATLDEQTPVLQSGVYAGKIDGNTTLNLFGQTLTCASGPNCSANSSDQSVGYPGWIFGGPSVNSSIGITLMFTLTPGDRVAFNTSFEVVGSTTPVPIPAAVWLLGSALVGVVGIGRRKINAI